MLKKPFTGHLPRVIGTRAISVKEIIDKIVPMISPPEESRDREAYDCLIVGKVHAFVLAKALAAAGYAPGKISAAMIYDNPAFVSPLVYHYMLGQQVKETGAIFSTAALSKKLASFQSKVTKIIPEENKVILENGKELGYKVLVLSPGLEKEIDQIKNLSSFDEDVCNIHRKKIFCQTLENPNQRMIRNTLMGIETGGNVLCYSPEWPYSGEGHDFMALMYNYFHSNHQVFQCATKGSKIFYATPNKGIFRMPYANEWALDQCNKRDITCLFEYKLVEVGKTNFGKPFAIMRNLATGEEEKMPFDSIIATCPCSPSSLVQESGLGNETGLLNVNPYTLQHMKFPNIFGMGDSISSDVTRSANAALKQLPVIKNNIMRYLEGKELNGIYDGYSKIMVRTSPSERVMFSHTYGYQPTTFNHVLPESGFLSSMNEKLGFQLAKMSNDKLYGFQESEGPPYYFWAKSYPSLKDNKYLLKNGISLDEVLTHPVNEPLKDFEAELTPAYFPQLNFSKKKESSQLQTA